jgi:cytochrome c
MRTNSVGIYLTTGECLRCGHGKLNSKREFVSPKLFYVLMVLAVTGPCGQASHCFAQDATGSADATRLRGQRLFLRCASCHDIEGSDVARIGPELKGVVGRKAGSLPDYAYSAAMKSADFTWDETMLDRWLTDPAALVPGTKMAFAGLPKAEDRSAIIAYLKQAGN